MKSAGLRLPCVVAMAAVAPSLASAQVYKCRAGGQAAYRDHPCAAAPDAAPHIAADPMPAPRATLADLRQMAQDAARKVRELSAGQVDADRALVHRSTGTSRRVWEREHGTQDGSWQNRIKPVQDHLHGVMDEMRRRCGKGGVFARLPVTGSGLRSARLAGDAGGVVAVHRKSAFRAWLALFALIALAGPWLWPGDARAADCRGPWPVGLRSLALEDGREISVWYPAAPAVAANGQGPSAADEKGGAPVAACASRWPLVLFSHGLAGCNEQAVFITEEIARHGYIVAAPNHRDAICGVATRRKLDARPGTTQPSFFLPLQWTSDAWRERMLDLKETLRLVKADAVLGRAIDPSRIGLMGHSLGGYTVVGMAGGWPDWRLPGVRAVLAFSPYVLPYLEQHRLEKLDVPVMYQGAAYDLGITPSLIRAGGAYDASPAPKYLVELGGATHMAWTNLPCRGQSAVSDCLARVANARLVDTYAIAFLDRHLKGLPAPVLDGKGEGLLEYRARR